MTAYYNEIDPYAAQWLRGLIEHDLIPRGDVDERSIADVRDADVAGYVQCHFFAGIGGWSRALRLAGIPDARPLWTGSCPCQPFSLAGARKGFADERHLWPTWRNLIAKRSPSIVLGEQVASATDWLRLVRGDLEAMGYAVGCEPIEAASAGADHLRDRFWFVANRDFARSQGPAILPERSHQRAAGADGVEHLGLSDCAGRTPRQPAGAPLGYGGPAISTSGGDMGDAASRERWSGQRGAGGRWPGAAGGSSADCEWATGADGKTRRVKPGVRLLANGIPNRVAKLRAFGNAIDPRPAAEFIKAVMQ